MILWFVAMLFWSRAIILWCGAMKWCSRGLCFGWRTYCAQLQQFQKPLITFACLLTTHYLLVYLVSYYRKSIFVYKEGSIVDTMFCWLALCWFVKVEGKCDIVYSSKNWQQNAPKNTQYWTNCWKFGKQKESYSLIICELATWILNKDQWN
mgnify:CR=1 FL=1